MLVTSLRLAADRAVLLGVTAEGAWQVATPWLPIRVSGAGDATAAIFLGNMLRWGSVAWALARTASAIFAVVEATWRSGGGEMRLIAAQEAIADPPPRFAAEQVR